MHSPNTSLGKASGKGDTRQAQTNLIHDEVEEITLWMGNQMLVPPHELHERDELEHRVQEADDVHGQRVPAPPQQNECLTRERNRQPKLYI